MCGAVDCFFKTGTFKMRKVDTSSQHLGVGGMVPRYRVYLGILLILCMLVTGSGGNHDDVSFSE